MADEKTSRDRGTRQDEHRERVLGVIAEPGPAERLADSLASELPRALESARNAKRSREAAGTRHGEDAGDSQKAGETGENGEAGGGSWRVEVVRRTLPLDSSGTVPLLDIGRRERNGRDWEAVVVLTELPRRADHLPVLADCAPEHRVGLVSLVAMGAVAVRRRTREMLVHLVVDHLADDTGGTGATDGTARKGREGAAGGTAPSRCRVIDEREARESSEEGGAQRAVDANVQLEGQGLHFTLPGWQGKLRLLAGMVRTNRPWRLVPSLSPALAGSTAGAAFGVFYSSIWQLADAFSTGRLLAVSLLAVVAMIAWLVLAHNLWERPQNAGLRAFTALYNAATVATVSCGVVIMFVLLFTATFLAALVIIPPAYLAKTLKHSVGPVDVVTVAWLASCLGTVVGALGSGLADEEAVRGAAFSRGERRRQDWRAEEEARQEQEGETTEESGGTGSGDGSGSGG